MLELDATDRRILLELQHDGRITNADLAQRIGLPPTSTSDRLRRLLRQGVITGFSARLDPQALGLDLLTFVEVSLDKTTPDVFERFASAIRQNPDVIECHMVAGGFDYLVKVRHADMVGYRRFLLETLLSFPGVHASRTYTVIEEIKSDSPLPV